MTPLRPEWWLPYCGGAYVWRGRTPQINRRGEGGVDCFGLHAHVQRHDFGKIVDDFGYAGDTPEGHAQVASLIARERRGWRECEWEEGAAALFSIAGEPVHIGTCTPTVGVVLHAYRLGGVDTLDVFNSLKWKRRFVGIFLPA